MNIIVCTFVDIFIYDDCINTVHKAKMCKDVLKSKEHGLIF